MEEYILEKVLYSKLLSASFLLQTLLDIDSQQKVLRGTR